jgi:ATP-binding cassette, subfamily B, bacterial
MKIYSNEWRWGMLGFCRNVIYSMKEIIKATKWYFILYTVLTIISSLFPVIQLMITTRLVNDLHSAVENDIEVNQILWLLGLQFLVLLLREIIGKASSLIELIMSQNLEFYLKNKLFIKLIKIEYNLFEDTKFLNQLERVQGEMGSSFLSTVSSLLLAFKNLFSFGTIIVFLFSMHWSLVFIPFLAAIPSILLHTRFGSQNFFLMKFQTPEAREQQYLSTLFTQRHSNKEVRLYNMKDYLVGKWAKTFKKNNDESVNLNFKQSIKSSLMNIYTFACLSSGTLILVSLFIKEKIRLGDFIASIEAIQKAQVSISGFAQSVSALSRNHLYIRDLKEIMELDEMPNNIGEFPEKVEEIKIENLSFSYPGNSKKVLKNISFTARSNETIMIVGENGAGKSTLMKCILGLYNIQSNSIMFNSKDINSISRENLMKNISIIFQDFMKYELTVEENIIMSNNLDPSHSREAAQKVGADHFIDRLPLNYKSRLGRMFENSTDLSGGQWQKIALARALYKDSQISILDEPTSALDPHSEHELFKSFQTISDNKITFYISHRMYTCHLADKILVLKNGSLIETGTHEELMNMGGEYKNMYLKQSSMYEEKTIRESISV